MQIKKNYSLKHFNTFHIDVNARYFVELSNENEIKSFLLSQHNKNYPLLILGGGSNILFTRDFEGTVLKIKTKGIEIVNEDDNYVFIEAAAGELWDDFVKFCVNKNFAGLENLSLIPGNVGSSPVQNIGAYGVELKDVFFKLKAVEISTGNTHIFSKEECGFDYRNSIFKNELKNKYVILSVTFKLSKSPVFNTQYGTIEQELKIMGVKKISISNIREAVCRIRKSKLPDTSTLGNAGSFFRNPIIYNKKYNEIKKHFPEITAFKQKDSTYKISAGWLIDQCGWKGKRAGNTGVFKKHPLILVNYGNAKGFEVLNLAKEIQKSVFDKFGIELKTEVNIL